ncbi:MAG: clan AA aspartic protease [Cytophagales bacterium]
MVYADNELLNAGDVLQSRSGKLAFELVKKVQIRAMVDTGAYFLGISENIKNQLGLILIETAYGTLADGSQIEVKVVGPVEVRFKNRRTTVDAMVLPGNSEVLLGAIPMEGMDVVINTLKQTIEVNPEHPYVPNYSLK